MCWYEFIPARLTNEGEYGHFDGIALRACENHEAFEDLRCLLTACLLWLWQCKLVPFDHHQLHWPRYIGQDSNIFGLVKASKNTFASVNLGKAFALLSPEQRVMKAIKVDYTYSSSDLLMALLAGRYIYTPCHDDYDSNLHNGMTRALSRLEDPEVGYSTVEYLIESYNRVPDFLEMLVALELWEYTDAVKVAQEKSHEAKQQANRMRQASNGSAKDYLTQSLRWMLVRFAIPETFGKMRRIEYEQDSMLAGDTIFGISQPLIGCHVSAGDPYLGEM